MLQKLLSKLRKKELPSKIDLTIAERGLVITLSQENVIKIQSVIEDKVELCKFANDMLKKYSEPTKETV